MASVVVGVVIVLVVVVVGEVEVVVGEPFCGTSDAVLHGLFFGHGHLHGLQSSSQSLWQSSSHLHR